MGCYTAQLLKLQGYNPLVIEEHDEVGRPVHCTGLMGKDVFSEKRSYKLPYSAILNVINGAIIYHENQSLAVRRNNVAYVVDRERFDKELSLGLNIIYSNKFLGLESDRSGGYIVDTDKGEFYADLVIAADGANSIARKILNPLNSGVCTYKGVQVRMYMKIRQDDLVRVYLKKGYFIWIVPEGRGVVRVGTISENPYHDLKSFMKEERVQGEIIEKFGGLVSIGICRTTVKDNIVLVGDAACQMKPLTYGGIYFSLKSADVLGSCIKSGKVKDYDALWKKELDFEIKIGLKIKEAYSRLDGGEMLKVFKLLKLHKSLLEKLGDFDNHSRIILELIKKPSLYPSLGELFRIIFKS